MLTPLATGLLWALSGVFFSKLQYREGMPGILDPLYQLPHAVHFGPGGVPC
ncbi:hypothetical protein [Rubrobacter calidifluminis]|uniref:hypothetical protein n=1 Tax=Rubrobacter calidifluminis TaxID=1392640 RepID=UPI00236023A0|nr:hypothetical protein [Rubrobacter calidifluminis]